MHTYLFVVLFIQTFEFYRPKIYSGQCRTMTEEENVSSKKGPTQIETGSSGPWVVLGRLQGVTLRGLEDGFERYGVFVASHPLLIIAACVALTVFCGGGLHWFRAENEGRCAIRNLFTVTDRC